MARVIVGERANFAVEIQDCTREADFPLTFIRMRLWIGGMPVGDFELEDLAGATLADIYLFLESAASLQLSETVFGWPAIELLAWIRRRDAVDPDEYTYDDDLLWSRMRYSTQLGVYSTGPISRCTVLVLDIERGQRVVVGSDAGGVVVEVDLPSGEVQRVLSKAAKQIQEWMGYNSDGSSQTSM